MIDRGEAPAIIATGLTKRYGDVTAVDDLTFEVRSGAVTRFLGPKGKVQLLRPRRPGDRRSSGVGSPPPSPRTPIRLEALTRQAAAM